MTMPLHFRAFWQLMRFEYYVHHRDFKLLYSKVRDCPLSPATPEANTTDRICNAVDFLCILFPKRVLCLQRSAATACLLKQSGVRAQLVIGAQLIPFQAHAWVEVDARVVNDKSYSPQVYAVIDRC